LKNSSPAKKKTQTTQYRKFIILSLSTHTKMEQQKRKTRVFFYPPPPNIEKPLVSGVTWSLCHFLVSVLVSLLVSLFVSLFCVTFCVTFLCQFLGSPFGSLSVSLFGHFLGHFLWSGFRVGTKTSKCFCIKCQKLWVAGLQCNL
jgi:hypothetical protein